MTKLSLSSPLGSPLPVPRCTAWLAPAALSLALAACSTTTTAAGSDDDGGTPPRAACAPAAAGCAGGARLRASPYDGFSAVLGLEVDPTDGAAIVLVTEEPDDGGAPGGGRTRLTRGPVDGEPSWALDVGAIDARIALDGDGTIALAGRFEGTIEALGETLSSEALAAEAGLPPRTPGLLLARIGRDGRVLAWRALSRDVRVLAVAARDGRTVVAGHAFGVSASTDEDLPVDAYVAILDADLGLELEEARGGAGEDAVTGAVIREDGRIVLVGTFEESIALGTISLGDAVRGPAAFAALVDPDLTTRGVVPVGHEAMRTRGYEPMSARPHAAPDGAVTVHVAYDGGDPEMETGLDRRAHALTFLDADLLTASSMALDIGADAAFGVALRPGGGYVLGGSVTGPLVLGGEQLAPRGSLDAFAMVLDEDGAPVWATRLGDEDEQWTMGIAPTAEGELVLGGMFRGRIAVGDEAIEATDMGSAFLVALPLP